MNQEIYCSVNNCHYWSQGNKCHATKIMVALDDQAADYPDSMDAPQSSTFPAAAADSCMDTCCKTFVHKGSNATTDDGVYKG